MGNQHFINIKDFYGIINVVGYVYKHTPVFFHTSCKLDRNKRQFTINVFKCIHF